jgi:hypothetical protein
LKLAAVLCALGAAPAISQAPVESFEPIESVAPFDALEAPDAGTVESFDAPEPVATVRVYGRALGFGSLDTRFESPRGAAYAENVAEGRLKVLLGLDAKLSSHLRVVVEGRAQVRLVTQRDFDRAKGFFEPLLGDAYADLYTPRVDLRVGNQRVVLGANAGLAPADVLNPRDLRESLMAGEPEDALLPVFALRAQGEWAHLRWLAVYVPFFTPHRFFVFGQDEALLQPQAAPSFSSSRIDPSIEDVIQERLLETKRPAPFLGDVALSVVREGPVTLGASWVWMNEKLPRFTLDPELSRVLASQVSGRGDDAAFVSVLNRARAGETLATGTYSRSHVFSLQASALVGPGQLDVDLAYSPRQTFVDPDFRPVDKAVVTWVVGFSQASDSPLLYQVAYLGLLVPDVPAALQLILLEPATAVGADRTAVLHLFTGLIGYAWFDKKLELSLRAAFEPIQLSFAAGPRVSYALTDHVKAWGAGEFYVGPQWSPLGYFSRNNKVLLGATVEF